MGVRVGDMDLLVSCRALVRGLAMLVFAPACERESALDTQHMTVASSSSV
jgi:hypothetical protein